MHRRSQAAQHIALVGVYLGAAAELPQAGIGYVVQGEGLLAEGFEAGEGVRITRVLQAPVEEQLRGRQHDAAVDIVLALHPGQIAASYRAHAAVAGQAGDLILVQLGFEADAVQRLQRTVGGGQVEDVAEELFHRARGAEAVQCTHHERGITQPAVAVIPVAHAAGASGMEVVIAAMIAPLSSYWHSFSVIALRITASCHSRGMDR